MRTTAPLADPLTRDGWADPVEIKHATTTIATLAFDGGGFGVYDFTDNQWHNQLLMRRLLVRGTLGELRDQDVVRLTADRTIVRSAIVRRQTGYDLDLDGFDTDHITFGSDVLYRNPFQGQAVERRGDRHRDPPAGHRGLGGRRRARAVPARRRHPGPPHRARHRGGGRSGHRRHGRRGAVAVTRRAGLTSGAGRRTGSRRRPRTAGRRCARPGWRAGSSPWSRRRRTGPVPSAGRSPRRPTAAGPIAGW